ncbi:MAG: hypothetical protein ACR2JB_02890 [Bryobacteraceae bacterium]
MSTSPTPFSDFLKAQPAETPAPTPFSDFLKQSEAAPAPAAAKEERSARQTSTRPDGNWHYAVEDVRLINGIRLRETQTDDQERSTGEESGDSQQRSAWPEETDQQGANGQNNLQRNSRDSLKINVGSRNAKHQS